MIWKVTALVFVFLVATVLVSAPKPANIPAGWHSIFVNLVAALLIGTAIYLIGKP